MWERRREEAVTCIACGERVARSQAREYDKLGDRWNRRDKEFEHLCKPCFATVCTYSRDGLEELLAEIDTGGLSRSRFLRRYEELVTEGRDPTESPDDPSG